MGYPDFYMTAPSPCPYLEGRFERKVFTHLVGGQAVQLNNRLTHAGFRRSQNIVYRPMCEGCNACTSVRVKARDFSPSRSQARIIRRNQDLISNICEGVASKEQFSLFRDYVEARHSDGGMSDMTGLDYASMVEDSAVRTQVVEYRFSGRENDKGELVAVAMIDELEDGLSMVYSFFSPDQARRSLGSFMILDHIERARARGLAYLYLGYWVQHSPKMDYKRNYAPLEGLSKFGWQALAV